ncbi:MAG: transporter, partial [Geminicoccaceae bacterium]
RETEIRRDEFDVRLAIDVGLPFDSQLELSQTFRHVDQMTMTSAGFVGLEESNESADVFDDLVVGLAKGLLNEKGWWPDVVARVTWDSDTGKERDGNIGLGGGSHELTGSLSFLKTRDPLAFFGGVSYGHTFEEEGFNPGDQIGVSLGTTLAAGPDTSLRLALSQSFISKAEIDGASIPGSKETSASLTAGASLVLGRGVLLDSSVTAGLTDDAPDYSARIALPVRFDPF